MKLVIIGAYKNLNPEIRGVRAVEELLDDIKKRGQLEGVEVDYAKGHPIETASEVRDLEFFTTISLGIVKKVKDN